MKTSGWPPGLALAIALAAVQGCALTTERVNLAYTPQSYAAKVQSAETVNLTVQVSDARIIRDRVSAKKNGYGMEMAAIVADGDVAASLAQAIQTELRARGFGVNGGPILVAVELSKFWNDFKIGFWAGSADAELVMNVQVRKADGTILFSKLVTGNGNVPSLQIMNGSNAKLALDAALNDAVSDLVNDRAFLDALIQASRA